MDYNSFTRLDFFKESMEKLSRWRASCGDEFETDTTLVPDRNQMADVFKRLTARLTGNYPFHHPCYAGQMLKPPHPAAWAAYILAMTINPNNHALDGGPPTSEMEKEVIAKLAEMVGYTNNHLGHLTGGGTIANLEALWVARQIHPGKAVGFSSKAHYTHKRMCNLLQIPSVTIPCSTTGNYDLNVLEQKAPEIGTLVVTMGTTGLGLIEPLADILELAKKYRFRVHLDAAYGGFFKLLENEESMARQPWSLMNKADSVVIDPHKHGLQPYGCGSVLFRDPAVGQYYKHNSPYTYFTSGDLHLGEISLECSRPGAAAAALWATLELLPLNAGEGLGPVLRKCRQAALQFWSALRDSNKYMPLMKPPLDIVGYIPVQYQSTSLTTTKISDHAEAIFERGMSSKNDPLFTSLYKIPSRAVKQLNTTIKVDSEHTTILRSVLMKPEHRDFIPEILNRLENKLYN